MTPSGSSPRVRGTVERNDALESQDRFIPACAGNRHAKLILTRWVTVHPRVCGEQSSVRVTPFKNGGSSPRVRGTGLVASGQRLSIRFIPACAGNSLRASGTDRPAAVHPRVCGEQFILIAVRAVAFGSSPRVRGTVHNAAGRNGTNRFIPACAGNRPPTSPLRNTATVHPRVCGEQLRGSVAVLRPCGSSPRVRGTADSRLIGIVELRFIPACAGNSREVTEDHRDAPVHPRVCGEQCSFVVSVICSGGSSPRVRGTVFRIHPGDARHRFIPACAGNRPDLAWADIS